MRDLSASFTQYKSKFEGITPIHLFSIAYGDSAASKVYWAEWNEDVAYYQPNTATAQTYTAMDMKLSDISYTSVDKSPQLTLTIQNIDRVMVAYMENNDGLRGREVNIVRTFGELLSNASACTVETYFVDGGSSTINEVQLTLAPLTTIYNIQLPRRTYRRDQCQWHFKGDECTGTSGTPTNSSLASSLITTCLKTLASCDAYNNTSRYGGFPGIPKKRVIFT